MMKTQIILHGRLKHQFKEKFEFHNINNLRISISAINSLYPDFKKTLLMDSKKGINYQIIVDRKLVKNVKAFKNVGKNSVIEIVPSISGADPATIIVTLVLNLLEAGISYLMTPKAKERKIEASVKGQSYIFSTPDNLARQGQTLPLGYGRLRIGSQIVSSTISNKDLNSNTIDNDDFGSTDNIRNQISEFLNLSLLKNNYL